MAQITRKNRRIALEKKRKRIKRTPHSIDYTTTHRRNVLNEAKIGKKNIEPGTIVRFNYTGVDAHEPRPMVLVLNSYWKGKLHGLALRVLSETEINRLARLVKMTVATKAKKLINLKLPKLKADISSPKRFYQSRIKKFIRQINDNPYRTYLVRNITNVNVLDYRFKDMA